MKPEEFVEMTAGLLTSRENAEHGSPLTPEATLDSLIGVARDLAAQAFARSAGLSAGELFDVLGGSIMKITAGAGVLVRHGGKEVRVARVDVRDDAIVLDLMDDEEKT